MLGLHAWSVRRLPNLLEAWHTRGLAQLSPAGYALEAMPLKQTLFALLCCSVAIQSPGFSSSEPQPASSRDTSGNTSRLTAANLSGLRLRHLGPAFMSGRIADLALHPGQPDTWYVAVASGGVWKTTNAGTTWKPIFDDQGSYSIGCVTVDPRQPLTVWVGTGENKSQRSVGYGDGLYKSIDGGTSWQKVGLEHSEHIAKIVIDPRDSQVVYVAAQGPLWAPGGDRGLFKTEDGGRTWANILQISENTGVTDLVYDPRNPDILLAASYQRRRHVWTLINGGPESGLHRSTDGGKTWVRIQNGLPKVELGKIGLALSANPDIVYAIVEAQDGEGGLFRSTDGGINWEKRSSYMSSSPQYYNELVADPRNPDRVYSMDVFLHRSDDGGKTWFRYPEETKHVDNHALWIDPANTDHLVAGCDGGLYESRDLGKTWKFFANLPVTQFYKVTPDNDLPFYNVYGGTQDNATQGGPSRTFNRRGIANADWFLTVFGDGFKTRIDPEEPDIVYSQWQYGGLVRFDRRSRETTQIQPQHAPGEDPLRWNWDSPLIISPHSRTRLYFGAQRLFRSDDRGDSWTAVSGDLTRNLDRNQLEVMGKVWSVDSVAKNASTSFYGNLVALTESPLVAGLIYTGSDDGLVQVTEDGGRNWRRIESVPGVPEMTYVNRLEASVHHADTVFAAFNNHKRGDFKPYLFKSTDRGRSWTSITGDLPARGSTYAIVEDHTQPDLLFAGTEFGLFCSVDGGRKWVQLKGGMPVVAVRDLEIQRREDDLVVGTFGRGIYILDDYRPLRLISEPALEQDAALFPVRKALMYMVAPDLDTRFQGDSFFTAPNPPFGAVFTYYLKEELKTLKQQRRDREKELEKAGAGVTYPAWEDLRAEDREVAPVVVLTVTDAEGSVVRRITGPVKAGFHRVAWDLRYPPAEPVQLTAPQLSPWAEPPMGPPALPGRYQVTLSSVVQGQTRVLAEAQEFIAEPLGLATLGAPDREELLAFQQKVARLSRAVQGSVRTAGEARIRIDHIQKALELTPGSRPDLERRVRELKDRLVDLQTELSGDSTVSRRNEPVPLSISDRISRIITSQWTSSSAATGTNREAYQFAAQEFGPVLQALQQLVESDLAAIERELEEISAPWTPGRVPRWQPE